ncbi:TPA: hypothetical protein EYO12_02750 [Candidatus Saccharibacteria bacterium]|nr:hypothetical protein [Candidatus Saccharibacteria bacterium]HIO88042.1 hypothetical protein [Candidatus Saccharibacteria bacterium]
MNEFPIIAVVGLPGSGKSELSKAIQVEHGYQLFDSTWLKGEYLKEYGHHQGDRYSMREFVQRQKQERGSDFIYRQAIKEARAANAIGCVVDGLRDPDDTAGVISDRGVIVGVHAPDPQTEFNRMKLRGRLGDTVDYDKFMVLRNAELNGALPPLNTGAVLEQAELQITTPDITDRNLRNRTYQDLARSIVEYAEALTP